MLVFSKPYDTSNTPVLDQALQNVFGDRSLVRNLGLTRNHEVNDDVSGMMDRDSFVAEASARISRLVQRNTPSLVTFCRSPVDQTPWERESQASLLEHDQSTCEVNLFTLVKSFVGHNLTTFLLGEAFVEAFPGLLDDLWTLDSNFVMLFIGTRRWVPSPGVSAGHAARDRLLHIMSIFYRAFTAWDDGIDPGIELRELDDVCDLFKERMRTFRKLELSPKASAAGHLSLYWDIVEHVTKVTYWTIVHIFADNTLLKDIREELLSSVKSSRLSRQETGFPIDEPPRVDLDLEKVLETCSLLKACYYESIRLHSASISFRKLEADLTLTESTKDAAEPRTYKIRKRENVIMPHGVYQNDPDRFSNPDQYDPLRFILTNAQSGTKQVDADSLAPLAHGIYGPKSNSITERATLGLVAAIVSMWDISATGEGSLSVPSHSDKMSWGAFQPAREMRVKLKSTV
ncbi:uncharacterized protein N7459_005496 [Penicillium hispanicum]|uniref:uncharacterized protein n=1 Tax=Penicillium hispanicum TaxID=1080232 RepID=UPI002542674E|nr:uncharacterized protein N7459_005496 [Penicillium hispanicum]KAJ5579511.1 hypothetical protein N7459_005496 [Penicillium hispanicum]